MPVALVCLAVTRTCFNIKSTCFNINRDELDMRVATGLDDVANEELRDESTTQTGAMVLGGGIVVRRQASRVRGL